MRALNDVEARRIARMIVPDLQSYCMSYDTKKYWPTVYKEVCAAFDCPKSVAPDTLRDALLWKYGHLGKANYPRNHSTFIRDLQRLWPRFVKSGIVEPGAVLRFFEQQSGRTKAFVTFAFLIHLLNQSTLPIIDQHNYRAVNHFVKAVRRSWAVKKAPRHLDDLYLVRDFIAEIRKHWPQGERRPNARTLDKFLMMYGKSLKAAPRRREPSKRCK